ncbi:DUF5615 family PIN-like protein [Candidatus Brocadia sinica]|uniref:DUF5615 family PIN-like protein n=1 Tax=Candidatus Brocadia sinica TaxID=795830 RepID=UPI0012FF30F9|nr:DUF5615 family PIN-like protein [Candidatus Brocadia sinica]NOG41279.1 DUF5615 family PIN-like protein [Planctomycetota bacterium]NUO04395.1 DUF5615 family PIN-like protein [Candidatus Brocadia sinica]
MHIGIINELRKAGFEILFIPEVELAGCDDLKILEYSERYDLILLSGDKDFGGLIEFGTLWGRGKVILLRAKLDKEMEILEGVRLLRQEAETRIERIIAEVWGEEILNETILNGKYSIFAVYLNTVFS